jgi:hypothetical protein
LDDRQEDDASVAARLPGHLEAGALARPAETTEGRPLQESTGLLAESDVWGAAQIMRPV